MSTASASHLSLILFDLCQRLTCSPSWAMVEVPCSPPSPFQLHVSIASLCRLSSENVHACKRSLFAKSPSLAFVGGEKQRKDSEIHYSIHVDCLRSMSMDARSHPLSLITLSLLVPCSFGLCREHVHKRDVSLLDGVMQGRMLGWKDILRRQGNARQDNRWERYVAATGTRPMIIWMARMDWGTEST